MKDLQEYNEYFEGIAANNKHIHSSFRINLSGDPFDQHLYLQEFLENLRSDNITYPTMLIQAYNGTFEDFLSDNRMQNSQGAFILLDHTEPGDFEGQEAALKNMELRGKRIMAYIYHDFYINHPERRRYRFAGTGFERIGPVGDNLFGARFDFTFLDSVNDQLVYSADHQDEWEVPLPLNQ